MSEQPNPNDHLGLVYACSLRAAQKLGGEVEDYIGQAWITLNRACATYDKRKGTLATHVYRAMSWKLYEQRRYDQGLRRTTDGKWIGFDYLTYLDHRKPSDQSEHHELRQHQRAMLLEASKHLTPAQRTTLELRLQGLSYTQIAKVVGISCEGVRQRLNKAIQTLKEVLG